MISHLHSLFAAAHTVARGFYPGKSVTYEGILELVLCHFLSAQGTEPSAFVSKWENRMRHSDAIAIFNGRRPAGDTSRADFWKNHAPKPKYRANNRPEERRIMYNREFLPGAARASTPNCLHCRSLLSAASALCETRTNEQQDARAVHGRRQQKCALLI